MAMNGQSRRPIVVMCALPASGHTYPLTQIAGYLVNKGFRVVFLGGENFRQHILGTGAEYKPSSFQLPQGALEKQFDFPPGPKRIAFQLKHFFLDNTAVNYALLTEALEDVRNRFPDEEVVIIHESMFMGLLPMYLGAPLPKGYAQLPKVINFHTTPIWLDSIDTAPFGPGLPPDPTTEGRARFSKLYDDMRPISQDIIDYANDVVYKSLGATTRMTESFVNATLKMHDITVTACSASLEYSRSDLPENIEFIGGLPIKDTDPSFEAPDWWDEIKANAALALDDPNRKSLVFATEGTSFSKSYDKLLLPTMKGLAETKNVIVVATLGTKTPIEEAILPSNFLIPANARVINYIPYDSILPLTDVFVSNAGYGGFMHGVMSGVPMVLAGTAADKAEVSMRGEWAGLAVNLKTQEPTPEMVREGVEKVLGTSSYKIRAMELKKENEAMDSLGRIEKKIMEFASLRRKLSE